MYHDTWINNKIGLIIVIAVNILYLLILGDLFVLYKYYDIHFITHHMLCTMVPWVYICIYKLKYSYIRKIGEKKI